MKLRPIMNDHAARHADGKWEIMNFIGVALTKRKEPGGLVNF